MKKVWYKCGCGCDNTKEEMVVVRKQENGKETNRSRCIIHQNQDAANIVSRATTCDECGVEFEFSGKGGSIPHRCDDCKHEYTLSKMRELTKKYRDEPHIKNKYLNHSLADPDRWDCGERSDCLCEHSNTRYETLPCKGCLKYTQMPMESDAMAARRTG